MITRLEPSIPMVTPKGKGNAHFLESIGEEHDYLWTVFQDTGEIWTWKTRDVRLGENITLGRGVSDLVEKAREAATLDPKISEEEIRGYFRELANWINVEG